MRITYDGKTIFTCDSLNPVVPKELTTYIVEAYVSMRQQDAAPSHSKSKSTNQAMMTARQLLSILVSISYYIFVFPPLISYCATLSA